MNALVMCGGRGTRLRSAVGYTEKPLVEVGDRPLIDRVVDAVWGANIGDDDSGELERKPVYAAVSPATPETAAHLRDDDRVQCLETSGEGYVADLTAALNHVGQPAVTVTADLPFLSAGHVERASRVADGDPVTICVPASLTASLGVSAETVIERDEGDEHNEHKENAVVPTGLNVVAGGTDRVVVWSDERLAFNVNRPSDLARAREFAEND